MHGTLQAQLSRSCGGRAPLRNARVSQQQQRSLLLVDVSAGFTQKQHAAPVRDVEATAAFSPRLGRRSAKEDDNRHSCCPRGVRQS
ncbi:unnamed protein product [Lampetra planeri]